MGLVMLYLFPARLGPAGNKQSNKPRSGAVTARHHPPPPQNGLFNSKLQYFTPGGGGGVINDKLLIMYRKECTCFFRGGCRFLLERDEDKRCRNRLSGGPDTSLFQEREAAISLSEAFLSVAL